MVSARSDFHIGLVLLAFAAIFFYFSFGFTQPAYQAEAQHVGPAFMPRLLLVALAILSLVLIFSSVSKLNAEKANQLDKAKIVEARPAIMFFAFAFYAYLSTVLGFVVTTLFFLVISFYMLGVKKLWQILILSPAITAAVYYLFAVLLNVWLPECIWL